MSVEKVIIIIIAMRIADGGILFFSRKLKAHGGLVRGLLLTLATVLGLAVLGVDWTRPVAETEVQGVRAVIQSLASEGEQLVGEQVEAVSLEKRPYLAGKKVAVIGDSITEIDGWNIPNVGVVTGYQTVFRQQGATVTTYGYSGATYAQYDKKVSSGEHRSIYDMIVKAKIDFKAVDVVTLFGGTNDVGRGYPLGQVTDKTAATTLGGLRGIIDYIKTNNPNCEIFIFTPIVRTDQADIQGKMAAVAVGIKAVADSYDLPVADLLNHSGITPDNQGTYLYDKLHPNSQGMLVIGQRMTEFIEESD